MRPLKKSFFGPDTNPGKQLKVNANLAGTVVTDCHIVRQKSTYKFIASNGVVSKLCKLVDKDTVDLLEGEMNMIVVPASSPSTELRVKKITAHKVKTFDAVGFEGVVFIWNDLSNKTISSQPAPVAASKKGNPKDPVGAKESTIPQVEVGGDDPSVSDDTV